MEFHTPKWLREDKVLSTTNCQQGLFHTYPRNVMIETMVLKTKSTTLYPAFVPVRSRVSEGGHVLKTRSTFVTHQRSPHFWHPYDPRRDVRLSNDSSSIQVLPHQIKQTPHETCYVRRTRTEMCQNSKVFSMTNTVNHKGKNWKPLRRNRNNGLSRWR